MYVVPTQVAPTEHRKSQHHVRAHWWGDFRKRQVYRQDRFRTALASLRKGCSRLFDLSSCTASQLSRLLRDASSAASAVRGAYKAGGRTCTSCQRKSRPPSTAKANTTYGRTGGATFASVRYTGKIASERPWHRCARAAQGCSICRLVPRANCPGCSGTPALQRQPYAVRTRHARPRCAFKPVLLPGDARRWRAWISLGAPCEWPCRSTHSVELELFVELIFCCARGNDLVLGEVASVHELYQP